MYLGKEVKVILKGQAKESYLNLKERDDKDARTLFDSKPCTQSRMKFTGVQHLLNSF